MNYAKPSESPQCVCRLKSPVAPTFCMSGHLTECHHPFDCQTAACSHLEQYGVQRSPAQIERAEESAQLMLMIGADPACEECGASGKLMVKERLELPGLRELAGVDEITVERTAICSCVSVERVEREIRKAMWAKEQ